MIDLEAAIENQIINESIDRMVKEGKVHKAIEDYTNGNRKVRKYGAIYDLDVEDVMGGMGTFATFKSPRLSKPYFKMLFTAMLRAPKLFVDMHEAKSKEEFNDAARSFYEYVKGEIEDVS